MVLRFIIRMTLLFAITHVIFDYALYPMNFAVSESQYDDGDFETFDDLEIDNFDDFIFDDSDGDEEGEATDTAVADQAAADKAAADKAAADQAAADKAAADKAAADKAAADKAAADKAAADKAAAVETTPTPEVKSTPEVTPTVVEAITEEPTKPVATGTITFDATGKLLLGSTVITPDYASLEDLLWDSEDKIIAAFTALQDATQLQAAYKSLVALYTKLEYEIPGDLPDEITTKMAPLMAATTTPAVTTPAVTTTTTPVPTTPAVTPAVEPEKAVSEELAGVVSVTTSAAAKPAPVKKTRTVVKRVVRRPARQTARGTRGHAAPAYQTKKSATSTMDYSKKPTRITSRMSPRDALAVRQAALEKRQAARKATSARAQVRTVGRTQAAKSAPKQTMQRGQKEQKGFGQGRQQQRGRGVMSAPVRGARGAAVRGRQPAGSRTPQVVSRPRPQPSTAAVARDQARLAKKDTRKTALTKAATTKTAAAEDDNTLWEGEDLGDLGDLFGE